MVSNQEDTELTPEQRNKIRRKKIQTMLNEFRQLADTLSTTKPEEASPETKNQIESALKSLETIQFASIMHPNVLLTRGKIIEKQRLKRSEQPDLNNLNDVINLQDTFKRFLKRVPNKEDAPLAEINISSPKKKARRINGNTIRKGLKRVIDMSKKVKKRLKRFSNRYRKGKVTSTRPSSTNH